MDGSVLYELLHWERSATRRTAPFRGESIIPGTVEGFVDRVARFMAALRRDRKAALVESRAQQFESQTATGSDLDAARRDAIGPIVSAFEGREDDYVRGLIWSKIVQKDEFIARRVFQSIPNATVSVVRKLSESVDCLRHNPHQVHRYISALSSRVLDPELPNRETLQELARLTGVLCERADEEAIWGCWLTLQCEIAIKDSPAAFEHFMTWFDDEHVTAIKLTARYVTTIGQVMADASGVGKDAAPETRSWTQRELDQAIRAYKVNRASHYNTLVERVAQGSEGAEKAAKEMFGRNVIAKALSVRSRAMVTKSEAWQEIAKDLRLDCKANRQSQPRHRSKSGIDKATEEMSYALGDSTIDDVSRRETLQLIHEQLRETTNEQDREAMESLANALTTGERTDSDVRQILDCYSKQKKDERSQKSCSQIC